MQLTSVLISVTINKENGISLVADGVIANEVPDGETIEKCRELGKLLA